MYKKLIFSCLGIGSIISSSLIGFNIGKIYGQTQNEILFDQNKFFIKRNFQIILVDDLLSKHKYNEELFEIKDKETIDFLNKSKISTVSNFY